MSGAGLMGGRDWSEGMTQGMRGFGQGMEMGQNKASRDMTNQVQMAQVQNSFRKNQLEREQEAKKQQAQNQLSNFVQSGGDVNSPEGKALLFNAGMGDQAVALSKPQAPVNPNLVAVVGPDGKPVYKPASEAAGMTPYKETPAKNTQTVQTAEGVFAVNPDGTRGERLGSPVRALNIGSDKPNIKLPSGYRLGADGESLEPIPGGPADKPAKTPDGRNLRKELNDLTKDYRTVGTAYSNIKRSAASNTGAGDMSMLYSFVKLLDPGSVVRESEFETAAASGNFGDKVQQAVLKLKSGERLSPDLKQAFLAEANNMYNTHTQNMKKTSDQYRAIAESQGIDPKTVIIDYSQPEDAPQDAGSGNKLGAPKVAGAAKVKDEFGLE